MGGGEGGETCSSCRSVARSPSVFSKTNNRFIGSLPPLSPGRLKDLFYDRKQSTETGKFHRCDIRGDCFLPLILPLNDLRGGTLCVPPVPAATCPVS